MKKSLTLSSSLFREKSGYHNEGVSWNSEEENRRLDINQVSARRATLPPPCCRRLAAAAAAILTPRCPTAAAALPFAWVELRDLSAAAMTLQHSGARWVTAYMIRVLALKGLYLIKIDTTLPRMKKN